MKNIINILLLIITFGFIACDSEVKDKSKSTRVEEAKVVAESKTIITKDNAPDKFDEIWKRLPVKSTPLIDTTNFDNLKEVQSLNTEGITSLQLSEIYPNIGKAGYGFKIMPSYKLELSDVFHAIVLNIFKGDHELETILINYSLEGSLIAHKVIAYDEIAEGWSRKSSKIEGSIITIIDEFYGDNKQVDTTGFYFNNDGEINELKTKFISDIRPDETIILNQVYTDTIEFLSYDDNYDYRLLLGKKNGINVGLIYNWDWQDNEKYNLKNGALLKVKWKMDRIIHAGDEEVLDFGEWIIDAEGVLSENNDSQKSELVNENTAKNNKLDRSINYFEFSPDTIPKLNFSKFDLDYAYQLDAKKIVIGYDKEANPDTEKDWGDKLLLLNNENEILFESFGVGDVYLFEPHFYKNIGTDKIVIICQLGFEYYFGGQAFLYENGKITSIGTLDIEGDDPEKSLTDIIAINELDNEIVFTFNADALVLEPGSEDVLIKNTGVKYIYKNEELTLVK